MKAKKCTSSTQIKKKPALVASEVNDNVCAFFKLLLEIDKRNNPALYENQESRNCSIRPFEGLIAFANVTLEEASNKIRYSSMDRSSRTYPAEKQ